jgi:hypothetical protein
MPKSKRRRASYRSSVDALLEDDATQDWTLPEFDCTDDDSLAMTTPGPGFLASLQFDPIPDDEMDCLEPVGENLCAVAERTARQHRTIELKTKAATPKNSARTCSFGRKLWLAACLIAAVCFFGRGTAPKHSEALVSTSSVTSLKLPTKNIEQIQVGDRVLTDLSDYQLAQALGQPSSTPEWDQFDAQMDPANWRQIELVMQNANNDRFEIVLLRPLTWLVETECQIGNVIHLVLPEQGLDGQAQVLTVNTCPPIDPGRGRVVTGTITHVRGGNINLYLNGISEPLGVTDNHPIFSVSRNSFVCAGELQAGDQLHNLDGSTATVERIDYLPGEQRVFNLEVHAEHVFRVMANGLLVHNACVRPGSKGHPDHQAKVAELAKRAESELGPGEIVLRERQVNGLPSRRRPDVQIRDINGKTRKVFEAERWPERIRNRLREAEYDRLGIDHVTEGL